MSGYDDGVADGVLRERVNEHGRRLDAINGSIDRNEEAQRAQTATIVAVKEELLERVSGVEKKVDGLGIRIGVYVAVAAAVATVVGSVASGLIVYLIVHQTGGTT